MSHLGPEASRSMATNEPMPSWVSTSWRSTGVVASADPGFYVIDIDATLVGSHSDKQGAAGSQAASEPGGAVR